MRTAGSNAEKSRTPAYGFQVQRGPAQPAVFYLERVLLLGDEIQKAMTAIGKNSIGCLEESIERQSALCRELEQLSSATDQERGGAQRALGHDPLWERIEDATRTLLALNGRYAALLKHTGDSLRVFTGLYTSYGESGKQTAVRETRKLAPVLESNLQA